MSDPRIEEIKRKLVCACGKPATAVEALNEAWHRACCDDHRPAEPAKLLTVDEYAREVLAAAD